METRKAGPLRFDIGGMHCAACSSRIERVVGRMENVERIAVNLATAKAQIWLKPGTESETVPLIMERVAGMGFVPCRHRKRTWPSSTRKNAGRTKRTGACVWGVWAPCCLCRAPAHLSMGHMLGHALARLARSAPRAPHLHAGAAGPDLPVVWLGRHFYREGLLALAHKAPTMDSLVAVGTGSALLYSLWTTLLGLAGSDPQLRAMNLYYESVAVLLTMIELGQFLEATAQAQGRGRHGRAAAPDAGNGPRLEADGQSREIPLADVMPGDTLVIRPVPASPWTAA